MNVPKAAQVSFLHTRVKKGPNLYLLYQSVVGRLLKGTMIECRFLVLRIKTVGDGIP